MARVIRRTKIVPFDEVERYRVILPAIDKVLLCDADEDNDPAIWTEHSTADPDAPLTWTDVRGFLHDVEFPESNGRYTNTIAFIVDGYDGPIRVHMYATDVRLVDAILVGASTTADVTSVGEARSSVRAAGAFTMTDDVVATTGRAYMGATDPGETATGGDTVTTADVTSVGSAVTP